MVSFIGHFRLSDVEEKLEDLASQQGTSVEHLRDLVEENAELQEKIIEMLNRNVMQDILATVIRSDRDNDFVLEGKEIDNLLIRLRSMKGVKFNYDKFLEIIEKDEGELTVADVVSVIRNLRNPSGKQEDCVFTFQPQDLMEQTVA